jgi:signal transduction histidine kinase
MTGRRDISFQRRLLRALVGIGVVTAALTCTLLIGFHFVTNRRVARADLETQVRMVAIHSEAALSFDDADVGAETLTAFRAHPAVVWAALYDGGGDLFATYDPLAAVPRGVNLSRLAQVLGGTGYLVLRADVTSDGQHLGAVVAAYDLSVVYNRLWRAIAMSLVAATAVVAGAVLLSLRLQRSLTVPLRELVATARRVSVRGDYAARARKRTQDEFGDLTDTFNEMLDRIESQQNELRRRNEEMQQLLYTVSHDLKSPLVTITGFAGLAREDVAQERYDQLEESLGHLGRAAGHMGRLIDNLLELSRIGRVRVRPEHIDTTRLAREVAAELEPRLAQHGASIRLQPDLPPVYADPVRLRQVFENLLTNAIKYGTGSGIDVIEVGGSREGDEARLWVRDHGPGIPDEHRDRVFTLFQRLHKTPDGTGVGLTIVAKIVEISGGRIGLEPTPGGGATFWFTLPSPSALPAEDTIEEVPAT